MKKQTFIYELDLEKKKKTKGVDPFFIHPAFMVASLH